MNWPFAKRPRPLVLHAGSAHGSSGSARRRAVQLTVISLGVAAALLTAWAANAPLPGPIVAPARVKVALGRKTVRHPAGGVVRRVLVHDGDLVRSGQPLIVVGNAQDDADFGHLLDQLDAERIRSARATTEVELAPSFAAPAGLARSPESLQHVAREAALFAARRRTLDEEVAALDARIRDALAQARALEQRIDATGPPTTRAKKELALARERARESRARIVAARNRYRQLATHEAMQSAARIADLEERLRPFRDQAERQEVRSPADGRVTRLRGLSTGEVIRPGDPLLDIVPTQAKLLIEARIRARDVAPVHDGALADVRLSTREARAAAVLLPGKIVLVSPVRATSREGDGSWYVADVEIDAAALARHPEIRPQPGMAAEVLFDAPGRTVAQSIAKCLHAITRRAPRET